MRLALLLLMGAAVASAQNKMGLWSPLYYKLNPSRDDEYAKFIDSVSSNKCLARSFQGAILTGPTSRPPPLKNVLSPGQDARSDEYQRRFDYLYKAGDWQPFGYIYTDYGRRPLDAVLEDVDRWCDAINGYRRSVRGVFIDQVAEDLTCAPKDKVCLKDYYQKVVDAIRSKCSVLGVGDAMIMLNPGRSFNECKFMADNKIGFVNGWEDTYDTYQKFSAAKMIDCPCKDKGVRCVASIHSVPENISQKQVEAVMTDMAANGFSAIFLTENKRPKQYETVPKIWPLTAQAACNVDAYVPKKRHMTRRLMKA